MKKKSTILIFIIISNTCFGQIDTTYYVDQDRQIRSLNDICKQIKNVNTTLGENENQLNDLAISIEKGLSRNLKIHSDSLVKAINELNTQGDKEPKFDWIQFISDSFVEALGAFIGFGGALFMYYYQKKNDKDEENVIINNQDKSKVNYLKIQLEACLRNIENQIQSIEKNNIKIDKNKLYLFQPDLYPIEDLRRLQNLMNNPEYYKAYTSLIGGSIDNTKEYRNIMAANDYFFNQFSELRKTDAIEFDHKRKLRYKALFDESIKTLMSFGESHKNSSIDLYEEMNQILMTYHNHNSPEKTETHQEFFIEPTRKLILNKYYELPGARKCLELLTETTQTYHDMLMQNDEYLKKYKSMLKLMKETYVTLEKNSVELKSYS